MTVYNSIGLEHHCMDLIYNILTCCNCTGSLYGVSLYVLVEFIPITLSIVAHTSSMTVNTLQNHCSPTESAAT